MKTVNIFTPVYHRYIKTRNSLDSILDTIKRSRNNIHLYIGINGIEHEEMKKWLDELAKLKYVTLYNPNENFGKAKIINAMHKIAPPSDYIISVDSDMVAHENHLYNWIDELVNLMEADVYQQFGLFSTWQDEANCHLFVLQNMRKKINNHEIWYGTSGGVAGGCLIMRNSDFVKIDRYKVMDVYNEDDAQLMVKVSKIGKLQGIPVTIKMKHPNNLPDEHHYQEWKTHKAHGVIPIGTKGFWDK